MMNSKNKNIFKLKRYPFIVVTVYLIVAFMAPLISNDKPLYLSHKGQNYFPAFSNDPYIVLTDDNGISEKKRVNNVDWKNLKADNLIFPPVSWAPVHSDLINSYASPFSKQYILSNDSLRELPAKHRHFLGTGKNGNDVLAGLIYGARNSISIGFLSMCIAVVLGIFTGGLAGYIGDEKLKTGLGNFFLAVLFVLPAWFYSFYLRKDSLINSFDENFFVGFMQVIISLALFIIIMGLPFVIRFSKKTFLGKKINIPVDSIISRFIEIFISLPKLILILTLAAISNPSVTSIILIIGFTSWTETARIVRAQVLQQRELNYIAAAKSFGAGTIKILFRHLLPNIISQVIVVLTFGIASAILIETGLSFLGIGLPADTATWGSIMFEARENFQAWWLVVFSGAAIFLLLSALYSIGNNFHFSYRKQQNH